MAWQRTTGWQAFSSLELKLSLRIFSSQWLGLGHVYVPWSTGASARTFVAVRDRRNMPTSPTTSGPTVAPPVYSHFSGFTLDVQSVRLLRATLTAISGVNRKCSCGYPQSMPASGEAPKARWMCVIKWCQAPLGAGLPEMTKAHNTASLLCFSRPP